MVESKNFYQKKKIEETQQSNFIFNLNPIRFKCSSVDAMASRRRPISRHISHFQYQFSVSNHWPINLKFRTLIKQLFDNHLRSFFVFQLWKFPDQKAPKLAKMKPIELVAWPMDISNFQPIFWTPKYELIDVKFPHLVDCYLENNLNFCQVSNWQSLIVINCQKKKLVPDHQLPNFQSIFQVTKIELIDLKFQTFINWYSENDLNFLTQSNLAEKWSRNSHYQNIQQLIWITSH